MCLSQEARAYIHKTTKVLFDRETSKLPRNRLWAPLFPGNLLALISHVLFIFHAECCTLCQIGDAGMKIVKRGDEFKKQQFIMKEK